MGKIDAAGSHRRKSGIQCRGRVEELSVRNARDSFPRYTEPRARTRVAPRDGYFLRAESFCQRRHRGRPDSRRHTPLLRRQVAPQAVARREVSLEPARTQAPRERALYLRRARGRPLAVAADVYAVPDKTARGKRIAVHRQHPLAYRHGSTPAPTSTRSRTTGCNSPNWSKRRITC